MEGARTRRKERHEDSGREITPHWRWRKEKEEEEEGKRDVLVRPPSSRPDGKRKKERKRRFFSFFAFFPFPAPPPPKGGGRPSPRSPDVGSP